MISPWKTNTFIDSCGFDPKYSPEDTAAADIFCLHTKDDLPLVISHSTRKEIDHPNTPAWVKKEAAQKVFSVAVELTPQELALKRKLLALLAGNGKSEKMAQDAEHIFEAQKYGSYFVTTDQRLLDKATEVRVVCGVSVMLPSEFLKLAREGRNATAVKR